MPLKKSTGSTDYPASSTLPDSSSGLSIGYSWLRPQFRQGPLHLFPSLPFSHHTFCQPCPGPQDAASLLSSPQDMFTITYYSKTHKTYAKRHTRQVTNKQHLIQTGVQISFLPLPAGAPWKGRRSQYEKEELGQGRRDGCALGTQVPRYIQRSTQTRPFMDHKSRMEDSCLRESIPTHYVVQEAVEAVTHVLWVPGD